MVVLPVTGSAQSSQRGAVLEYKGAESKTPLSGVSVSASNAGSVISDEQGEFTLQFRTLHAGDAIQFRRIERSGYEVMNTEALEAARIARVSAQGQNTAAAQGQTLSIVMVRRETLQKLRDGYRKVATQRYEKQLHASEAEIERLRREGKLAEEQYNERMNALEEEYEEKLSKLENYIDRFARVDLSDLDADEQKIIDLVQAGDFDEALRLYDSQNLADRLRQSREDQKKLTAARDQIAEAARQKAIENARLRQSIDRQIVLLMMAGGEENLMKVHEIRHQVFLADTTDVSSRTEYANSLVQHNMTPEAITLLNAGIASTTDSLRLSMMYLALTSCHYEINQFAEAMTSLRKADALMQPFSTREPQVCSQHLPTVYFGYLLQTENLSSAETAEIVDRAISQWNPDTLNVRSVDKYCLLLKRLTEHYLVTADHEKAVWAAREGMKLGEIMQRRWPWTTTYVDNCAFSASSFALEGMHEEMIQSASTYIELLRPLLNAWSSTSKVLLVLENSFYTLEALEMYQEYALADSLLSLMEQAQVMQILEKKYSSNITVKESSGRYRLEEAMVRLAQGRIEEAETIAVKALDRIASTEIGAYYIGHMRPGTMGRIRLAQGRYKEAESLYQEAIAQSKAIYDADPNDFDADTVCRYYIGLSEVYRAQGDQKSARKVLKLAKKYAAYGYDHQLINNIKN